MTTARIYIDAHAESLQMAVSVAFSKAIRERASDPVARVGELLLAAAGAPRLATDSPAKSVARPVAEGEPLAEGAEWTLAAFAASLGVARTVTTALLNGDSTADQFELAKSFASQEAIAERLRAGSLVEQVAQLLWTGVAKVKAAEAATAAQLNAKFAADGDAFKGEMGFGGTEEFYAGLEAVVGAPTFLNGSLLESMRAEHCEQKDANLPFDTSNGIVGATSAREWEFVSDPKVSTDYAERSGFRETHPDKCRKAEPLAVYEEKMRLKNEELARSGGTPLILEELVAGRAYTGPMYEKYNAVLRFAAAKNKDGSVRTAYPTADAAPFLQQKCGWLGLGEWVTTDGGVRWEWHNTYTTTIHAVNSVVVKCSRLTKIQPLFRGWTGATLPQKFFQADDMGVKGGIEYGFSSTTTEREQAVQYADGKASTLLELEMGMVDRGADISWLSQYPHEKETLLPPLMGLQVRGMGVDGGTLVVQSRLSINMASLTLEQVAGKRKKLLQDMSHQMAVEVRKDVPVGAAEAAGGMVQVTLRPLLDKDAREFNVDVAFQEAVAEALKVKRSVELAAAMTEVPLEEAMLKVEPLQGNVVDLSELQLGQGGSDVAVVTKWMRSVPGGLTRLTLNVKKVCGEVVPALHELVARTATLVDLDIKEGGSLNVLQLNGREAVESLDFSRKKLGTQSAGIIAACIEVNKTLASLNLSSNALCGLDRFGHGTYTAEGVTALCEGMKGSALTSLNLRANSLGPKGGAALAKGLKGNTTLKELNVSKNGITGDAADNLAKAVLEHSAMTSFCEIPLISLRENSITELGLEGMDIGVPGAIVLSKLLPSASALVTLNIRNNNLTDNGKDMSGVLKLAEALPQTKLTSLDLDNNYLGPKGGAAIAEGLKGNTTLKELNLADNQLCGLNKYGNGTFTAEGITALCEGLKGSAVTSLDVSENALSVEGCKAIAAVLKDTQITTLSIAANTLTNDGKDMSGVLKLAEALPQTKLTSLNLADNALCGVYEGYSGLKGSYTAGSYTADGITALCEGLKGSTVTSLNLRGNNLDDEAERALEAATGSELAPAPLARLCSPGFSTIGMPSAMATSGQLYYEVELHVVGDSPQIGWATAAFDTQEFPEYNGVGDCESSWAADGARKIKWHGGETPWTIEWRNGDVVGVAADVGEGSLLFARNGEWVQTFDIEPGTGLFPALSTVGSEFTINTGASFRHPPPPGFAPVPLTEHALVLMRGPPLRDRACTIEF